jgi:WD40 repeat protein
MNKRIFFAILINFCNLHSISSAWANDANSQKLEKPSSSFFNNLLKLGGEKSSDVATKIVSFHESFEAEGLAFSPDGRYLATTNYVEAQSGDEREVHIWDWRNAKLVQKLTKPKFSNASETTNGLQWSPDGRFLAVCTGRAENHEVIRIWSTHDWQIASDIIDDGAGGCNSLAFSLDSRFLLRAVDRVRPSINDDLISYSTNSWQKSWGMRLGQILNQGSFFYPETMAISHDGKLAALEGIQYKYIDGVGEGGVHIVLVDLIKRSVVNNYIKDNGVGLTH